MRTGTARQHGTAEVETETKAALDSAFHKSFLALRLLCPVCLTIAITRSHCAAELRLKGKATERLGQSTERLYECIQPSALPQNVIHTTSADYYRLDQSL